MMCTSSVNAKVVEFNCHIVAAKISESYGDWVMVGFYGPCYASKRQKAWTNLSALLGSLENPWTCIGEDRAEVMHGKIKDRAGIL